MSLDTEPFFVFHSDQLSEKRPLPLDIKAKLNHFKMPQPCLKEEIDRIAPTPKTFFFA